MIKVEQIISADEVVLDYDQPLSQKEIRDVLERHFQLPLQSNPYQASHNGRPFKVCAKSITYLGKPHPVHKKRIQIPGAWKEALREDRTFLLGIYRYNDNLIFVLFDTSKYKNNRLNNSSAHVHTIDIQKGMEYGIFAKTDASGNKLTVFTEEKILEVFSSLLKDKRIALPPEIDVLSNFAKGLETKWDGKAAYALMEKEKFNNAIQAEWQGFFLEYQYIKYSNSNTRIQKICSFVSNKKGGELDFDLNFHNEYLGDLKAHSVGARTIPGNDKRSLERAVSKHKIFWYVVFSHETKKDRDHGHEVTRFWNFLLNQRGGKKDELSYGDKMKHSVELKEMTIYEVNRSNVKYLQDLPQGRNSNNQERNMKIQINKKDFGNFLIYKKDL